MTDLKSVQDTLLENDFVEDNEAKPAYNSMEYVKERRDGTQTVCVVDHQDGNVGAVSMEEYNQKGVLMHTEKVSLAFGPNFNRFLSLAGR